MPTKRPLNGRLSGLLMQLAEDGVISRKLIQFAADTSRTTVQTWFAGERLPDLGDYASILTSAQIKGDAKLAIARTVHQGTHFSVGIAPICKPGPIKPPIDILENSVRLVKECISSLSDRILTNEESQRIGATLATLRTQIDELDQSREAQTARRTS